MKVTPAIEPEHGSLVVTREGLLGLVIGIPRPQDLLPIIPKYVPCRESPWSRRGLAFCRVLEAYGPLGVESVISRLGFKEYLDGVYNSLIPYVRSSDVIEVIKPRDALSRILSSPGNELHYKLLELLDMLRMRGVALDNVGLTGSLAIGIENPTLSDLDLVVYGYTATETMYKLFVEEIGARNQEVGNFGGLTVEPKVNLGWRRANFKGTIVGWVGVPGLAELCKPLNRYFTLEAPLKPVEMAVEVKRGQPSALTYPPCVKTDNNIYIVSFEYNVGALLYEGGFFKVMGLADRNLKVIFLATRQKPGHIERIA